MASLHPASGMQFATAVRLLSALVIAAFMSIRGLKKRSLSLSGAIAAFFVGLLSFSASTVYGVLLLVFYLTGSRATRVKQALKKKWDLEVVEGEGHRGAVQVLCTAGLPTALALAHVLLYGLEGVAPRLDWCSETPPPSALLFVAIVAAYATACGDTWASELGILSRGAPVLVVGCFRVPRGTNGGVSSWGLLMSLCGGALIGAAAVATIAVIDAASPPLAGSDGGCGTPQLWLVALGAAYGLLGSVLDSVLGAVLQRSFVDVSSGRVTCRLPPGAKLSPMTAACAIDHALAAQAAAAAGNPPPEAKGEEATFAVVCGYNVLSNEQVNLLSAAMASGVAVFLTATPPSATSSVADFGLFLGVALAFIASSAFVAMR